MTAESYKTDVITQATTFLGTINSWIAGNEEDMEEDFFSSEGELGLELDTSTERKNAEGDR